MRPLTYSQPQTPPSCLSSLFTILPPSQLHLLWSWSAEGEDGKGAEGVGEKSQGEHWAVLGLENSLGTLVISRKMIYFSV